MQSQETRVLDAGAEVSQRGTHFRVWAPRCKRISVDVDGKLYPMEADTDGYFEGFVAGAAAGARYRFQIDDKGSFPDPVSRYQPEGPHGPSEIVDPSQFEWSDRGWKGLSDRRQVFYELHVGTFTREGTYRAAADKLVSLLDIGVTAVELLPLAEFPGRFGWGYDGVSLFAPFHGYGTPDDFRAFVDHAHSIGLGVILDVVYNHFGPDGNYLGMYSDGYVSKRHKTEWGDALNFDGDNSGPVRRFVLDNVRHWISEYHLDGLRLDATHSIYDDSSPHILTDIGVAARQAGGPRSVLVIAENEPQESRIVRPRDDDGYALDYIWCDDFHHAARVSATGRREAYFTDYRGTPQEFVSAIKYGILYQGQRYKWQDKRRGWPAFNVAQHHFVFYLENHDQIANSRDGRRLHQLTSPGRHRALTAVFLLAPQTPMLFQGQEFASSAPFLYFCDHNRELSGLVRKGRKEFLSQFASIGEGVQPAQLDDPGDPATFARSTLDWSEREKNESSVALHRDLIALRQCDPVFCEGCRGVDGAVLSDDAFAIRFFTNDGSDRLLLVNLGSDLELEIVPEPLLAPPNTERGWSRIWYSEDPRYGGGGAPVPESRDGRWRLPAESATLMAADCG